MRDWLKVNSILCSMAMVLKCIALTLVMQTVASRHPCPYGICRKVGDRMGPLRMPGDWVKEENRTLESLREHQTEWREKGRGNRARLMDFYNVEFEPLFTPYRPD